MDWKRAVAVSVILAAALALWMHRYNYERVGETVVRINRVTGDAYLLRGNEGWVAFDNLSDTGNATQETSRRDTLTPEEKARKRLENAREQRLENQRQANEADEEKSGVITRGSLTFSSILVPIVLGFLARFYLGKQRWYYGVLFFIITYPSWLVLLVGIYLNLGMSGGAVITTAGSNSIWGTTIGALLLSSGWFSGTSEKQE